MDPSQLLLRNAVKTSEKNNNKQQHVSPATNILERIRLSKQKQMTSSSKPQQQKQQQRSLSSSSAAAVPLASQGLLDATTQLRMSLPVLHNFRKQNAKQKDLDLFSLWREKRAVNAASTASSSQLNFVHQHLSHVSV